MVLLFIESATNEFTVTLESPIYQPKWVILHSVSLSTARILAEDGKIETNGNTRLRIPAGKYTLDSIIKAIDIRETQHGSCRPARITRSDSKYTLKLETSAIICNALKLLLDIETEASRAKGLRFKVNWPQFQTAWIHCDLADVNFTARTDVSSVARKADILGVLSKTSGHLMEYSSKYPVRVKARAVERVHNIHFQIKDENGTDITIDDPPFRMVLEIE